MKKLVLITILAAVAAVHAAAASDVEFLYSFMAGTYHVIGKHIDSDATYAGTVILENRGTYLRVTRQIGGTDTTGEGRLEPAVHGEAKVLRVRFHQDGRACEATYLWHTDLDNYPVFAGYVTFPGEPTDTPGMEAMFIDLRGGR